MRILRFIILSIIVIFTIVTVISLFIPPDVRITKAAQIHASKDSVFALVADPSRWSSWYPNASLATPLMRDQKQTGLILNAKGQTIELQTVTNDEVKAAFTWNGRKIPTGWVIASAPGEAEVTVQWYIDFHLRWYPWEKFTSFLFERIYQPQLKDGVERLKAVAEHGR